MSATDPRLFLALWPTAETRAGLEAHGDAWSWPAQARRTRPERLHVTLHFLGVVPLARLPELRTGLQVEADDCELLLDRAATGARPPAFPPLHWRARPGFALVQSLGGGAGYAELQAFA